MHGVGHIEVCAGSVYAMYVLDVRDLYMYRSTE